MTVNTYTPRSNKHLFLPSLAFYLTEQGPYTTSTVALFLVTITKTALTTKQPPPLSNPTITPWLH